MDPVGARRRYPRTKTLWAHDDPDDSMAKQVSMSTSRSAHRSRTEASPRMEAVAKSRMRTTVATVALAGVAVVVAAGSYFYAPRGNQTPVYTYEVVAEYPHDAQAYTQGLTFDGKQLWEGTGQYGRSELRKVELETGKVLGSTALPADLFGEGIAIVGDKIFQLTWQQGIALVYDKSTLAEVQRHTYNGQGWGLTYDGQSLIMSDGSSTLKFLDPTTFRVTRQVKVRDQGRAVSKLNELEYVAGKVMANIWYRDRIAIIDPQTGNVEAWIDLESLYPQKDPDAVLNGIAYQSETKRLIVTGKNWPKLYEIRWNP